MSTEARAAQRFARDTAEHVMTVLHDDGPYRHLRFRGPRNEIASYEIVTWPGSLAVRGDLDDRYVFTRSGDMFAFFRRNGNEHGINPGYWAEKLPGDWANYQEYSKDLLLAKAAEAITAYRARYPQLVEKHAAGLRTYDTIVADEPIHPDDVSEMLARAEDEGELDYPEDANGFLLQLQRVGVAENASRWDLLDWRPEYLWVCHAVVAGIARYDAVKALTAQAVPA